MRAVCAVVLAAGRGTRMRRESAAAVLDDDQQAMADRGLKALIPFDGRPFIAYLLDEIAAAGFERACVVTGPHTGAVREHLEALAAPVALSFAGQAVPRGSADALLAAEPHVAGAPFIAMNADNLYPRVDLSRLAGIVGVGLVGYGRQGLERGGIPAARTPAFALIEESEGRLTDIVEKPDAGTAERLAHARVSMNCWRFDDRIFEACRSIRPSPRGEYELPDAVRLLVRQGVTFTVVHSDGAVADLSAREDVPRVATFLSGRYR